MASFKHRIAEVLIAQRLAGKEQVDALIAESSKEGKSFARLLVERQVISEAKLTELLSKELGLPSLSVARYKIDESIAAVIPERLARQYLVMPLSKFGDYLMVAMADPLNIFAMDDLKALTGYIINPVLSGQSEIRQAIERVYVGEKPAGNGLVNLQAMAEAEETIDAAVALMLDETTEDTAPVVRVINLMVAEAIRAHASDIHLEPLNTGLRVRYRIDGRLSEPHRLPKAVQSSILARLKIMSGLDITESRLPQDGRFKARLGGHEVDFRVSVLPISHGGKVVLRLLDKSALVKGLDHLGFLPDSLGQFKAAVKRPYGMILVTGPTGSGKSTTLYSVLNELNHPARHLITIEDPVEYQIEGITQVQVNPEVGVTFANGLRAVLRQSPDVVMIGEIRDFETADIAMKSSLTGQLVLSTLHTNDASSAVTRLIDMGVEPFLVAASLSVIEAQRLVRRLCPKCRQPYTPEPQVLKQFEGPAPVEAAFYRPVGCRQCNGSGFRGRLGILEVVPVDEHIRELIVSRVQSYEIKNYAMSDLGMVNMRLDGLKKAAMGLTTLEEVLEVTAEE